MQQGNNNTNDPNENNNFNTHNLHEFSLSNTPQSILPFNTNMIPDSASSSGIAIDEIHLPTEGLSAVNSIDFDTANFNLEEALRDDSDSDISMELELPEIGSLASPVNMEWIIWFRCKKEKKQI